MWNRISLLICFILCTFHVIESIKINSTTEINESIDVDGQNTTDYDDDFLLESDSNGSSMHHSTNIEDDNIIRETTFGLVRGEKRPNSLKPNDSYYAFHAIPYAAPPTGSLRFKPPQAPAEWDDIYNASDSGDYFCCPQPNGPIEKKFTEKLPQAEDCLHLSVYTPSPVPQTGSSLLPVVVWIHGGGFKLGCGMYPIYGPERFMLDNDVVMVSINYRLGMLGFLSLADTNLAGNMGLLDQVMALKWVQTNIKEFGGDPERVTIMGESAGSWSAFYHMISPLSKGLFQQVIGQSGTFMSPAWKEYTEDEAVRWGQSSATALNCSFTTSIEDQIQCLQDVPLDEILSSSVQVGYKGPHAVIDGNFTLNSFLPEEPKLLMSSGSYNKESNVLLGVNRDEGIFSAFAAIAYPSVFNSWKLEWRDGGKGASKIFGIEDGMQESPKNSFKTDNDILAKVDKVTEFYFGNLTNMTPQNTHGMISMLSDAVFIYGVHDFVTRHLPHAGNNSVFQYLYSHEGAYSFTSIFGAGPYGVSHYDEVFLQFHPMIDFDYVNNGLNKADSRVSKSLLALWKNFIKTGNPSTNDVNWSPVKLNEDGETDRKYLKLSYPESSFMEYPKE